MFVSSCIFDTNSAIIDDDEGSGKGGAIFYTSTGKFAFIISKVT